MQEAETVRAFADVEESHPLYQTVQDAIRIGLVQPAAGNDRLYPDRPVTLQEANEMGDDMLGTEKRDHAFSQVVKSLRPQDALTRADLAVWLVEWEAAAKNSR